MNGFAPLGSLQLGLNRASNSLRLVGPSLRGGQRSAEGGVSRFPGADRFGIPAFRRGKRTGIDGVPCPQNMAFCTDFVRAGILARILEAKAQLLALQNQWGFLMP